MIAVSVDYRLKTRDKVEVPLECVKDAKSVIRYLRTNAAELKIAPNKIVAAVGSAGGQLAASTAMITYPGSNDTRFDLAVSAKPNAVILYNPWFRCAAELSPKENVTEKLPPFITFAGGMDTAIPIPQMQSFHNEMKSKGNRSLLYVGNEGKHGFCNGRNPRNRFFYWSLELADQFLVEKRILSGDATIKRPQGVAPLKPGEFVVFD